MIDSVMAREKNGERFQDLVFSILALEPRLPGASPEQEEATE
jgi:hypothetical protein